MWRKVKGDRLGSGLSPFCFFLMGRLRCGVACPVAEFAGGTGCPSRLCQEGKRKLTESAKEFLKDSAWQSPKGPFREALERKGMPPRYLLTLERINSTPEQLPHSSADALPRMRVL